MDDETTSQTPPEDPVQHRHRMKIALVLLGLAVLLVIALTPPLVNLNRLERRIVTSMSASLGRNVTIDPPVTFHVFPTPGFTLHNLVVSEDPAFGSEPIIRCMNVRAQLRLLSLWRHDVEFSKISFEPDENGTGPSINIVRLPDGRTNLEALLLKASRIDAAPTSQTRPGSAPRFPYIEARAARVNLKLGNEKEPLSLVDAELALWLPSSHQWSFQLRARPVRTDLDTADTGLVRAEGSLERNGSTIISAPIRFTASWHDAPLGEASRLLTGSDMGWRGTLQVDTTVTGTLAAATVDTHTTFTDLRRADFVPAAPLDLAVTCHAAGGLNNAHLDTATCTIPTGGASPLRITATDIDLSTPSVATATVTSQSTPLGWLFGWFKILTPRTPQQLETNGVVDASLTDNKEGDWNGEAAVTFPGVTMPPASKNAPAEPLVLAFQVAEIPAQRDVCRQALTLAPTAVPVGENGFMSVAGEISPCGYTYRANGHATTADLDALGAQLPTLSEGFTTSLTGLQTFDITCMRSWGAAQSCHGTDQPLPTHHHR